MYDEPSDPGRTSIRGNFGIIKVYAPICSPEVMGASPNGASRMPSRIRPGIGARVVGGGSTNHLALCVPGMAATTTEGTEEPEQMDGRKRAWPEPSKSSVTLSSSPCLHPGLFDTFGPEWLLPL